MGKKFPKIVKVAKDQLPWIEHLVDEKTAHDLSPVTTNGRLLEDMYVKKKSESLCIKCKGGKMLSFALENQIVCCHNETTGH
jgi:hypothetical protein